MEIVLWTVAVIGGLYLLLVVPAGIAMLFREITFRKSPDRRTVLAIIEEYRRVLTTNERLVEELVASGRREVVRRDGVAYSVDLTAKRLKGPKSFEMVVSVGRLRRITIGHAEKFQISYGSGG